MKFWKTSLLASGAVAIALTFGQAQATPVPAPLTSLPAPGTTVVFKYNNLEACNTPDGACTAVGDVLSGIFSITSINNVAGTETYFSAGSTLLTGYFTGLTVTSVTPTSTGQNVQFEGGTLNIYAVPAGSYNPTAPATTVAGLQAQICPGGVCPTPFLSFNFVPGIVPTNPTTTLNSNVTALTAPLTGSGFGNLVVTGGTAAGSFGTDFSLNSNLSSCPSTNTNFAGLCTARGSWQFVSFDPVQGQVASVPEPQTLALLAIAMVAGGLSLRRRVG